MRARTRPLAKIFNLVVPHRVEALNRELITTAALTTGSIAPEKQWEKIESLLRRGANIDAQDDAGNSVLLLLCDRGNSYCAIRLLGEGAQAETSNNAGATPFIAAARAGDPDLLQAFLDAGIDRHQRNLQKENAIGLLLGAVPLGMTEEQDRVERRIASLKLLLDAGVALDKNMKMRILHHQTHYLKVVPELKNLADMDEAMTTRDVDGVYSVMASGVHPDAPAEYGNQAVLSYAAGIGDIALMDTAVKNGARLDLISGDQRCTALQNAVVHAQRDAFVHLLDLGANPDQQSLRYFTQPLYEAAQASADPKATWAFISDVLHERTKDKLVLQSDIRVKPLRLKKPAK